MKSHIKVYGWLLALCGAAAITACKSDDSGVSRPTDLQVTSIGDATATLSWAGNADSFQLDVNGDSPVTSANSYVLTGLTPLTSYTWRVRAITNAEASEWVDGPSFTTVESVVSVDFGDGEEVWVAGLAEWYDYQTEGGAIDLFFTSGGDRSAVPAVQGAAWSSGETLFPNAHDSNGLYFEYYSAGYWDGRFQSGENDAGDTVYYGDWRVKEGAVTVTAYRDSFISGTIDMVMYDYYDSEVSGNTDPAEKNLRITFVNVPEYAASRNAVRGITR